MRKLVDFFCCGDARDGLGNWRLAERSCRAGRVGRVLVSSVCGGDWTDMTTIGDGGSFSDDVLLSFSGVRSCVGRGWVHTLVGGFASGVAATHSHRPSSHL